MARRATIAMIRHLAGLLALAFALLIPSAVQAPTDPVTALAPVELWSDGFLDLRGIVVDPVGNVYVADREARTVTRIAPDRTKTILASNLERPIGLAFDLQGRLLIAEEKAGRVVRLETTGVLTPLISNVKQPRWLAMHENGTLYQGKKPFMNCSMCRV
jgi:sugar lactone lactonase YvrE